MQQPQLRQGSPPLPGDRLWPTWGAGVFVDTNVVVDGYVVPFPVCAQQGFLRVHWSTWVAAELARATSRAWARRAGSPGHLPLRSEIEQALEIARQRIDGAVARQERWWATPDPASMRRVNQAIGQPADATDRPILVAAHAARVAFLVSLDKASFPHGGSSGAIAFWHPDTFLTALCKTNDVLYETLSDECAVVRLTRVTAGGAAAMRG